MWDERYASEEYLYGREPNGFLVSMVDHLPKGQVLCLGEGEGRNGVWLARLGFEVTALDASGVGLAKARRLAEEHGVPLHTVHSDLAHYAIEPESWDGVISIFCHTPAELRRRVHRAVVAGLRPGGVLILEAYTPRQLEFGTGGPPVVELMMDLHTLRDELAGLELLHAEETEREIHEGRLHTGRGAVVQIVARKP